MPKRLVILGSTGSIGRSTMDVADALPEEFSVVGIAAHRNWQPLAEQVQRLNVPAVAIADEAFAEPLRAAVPPATRVLAGAEGLRQLVAESQADFVMSAIVGAAGLPATLTAVERGINVGIANKESLVVAGCLLMPLAARTGSQLIPVDSEHSAIFQCLRAGHEEDVRRLILTASGGPFRQWPIERIAAATLTDALNHPTWSMGPKVTIDSATMMNKALEVIEAHWLFGFDVDRINVLVHPESIIHSMVEFNDGSVIAQLGTPDMKTPIQYALTYPRRMNGIVEPMDWSRALALHFEPPDYDRFPALRLGFEAARRGGTFGAVLNAANEAAVEAFRAARIPFGKIVELTHRVFETHRCPGNPSLADLLDSDAWARDEVNRCLN